MAVYEGYSHLDLSYFAELVSFALKRQIEISLHAGGRVELRPVASAPEGGNEDYCTVTIKDANGGALLSAEAPRWLLDAVDEWRFAA
jgi:hypothetical protein